MFCRAAYRLRISADIGVICTRFDMALCLRRYVSAAGSVLRPCPAPGFCHGQLRSALTLAFPVCRFGVFYTAESSISPVFTEISFAIIYGRRGGIRRATHRQSYPTRGSHAIATKDPSRYLMI